MPMLPSLPAFPPHRRETQCRLQSPPAERMLSSPIPTVNRRPVSGGACPPAGPIMDTPGNRVPAWRPKVRAGLGPGTKPWHHSQATGNRVIYRYPLQAAGGTSSTPGIDPRGKRQTKATADDALATRRRRLSSGSSFAQTFCYSVRGAILKQVQRPCGSRRDPRTPHPPVTTAFTSYLLRRYLYSSQTFFVSSLLLAQRLLFFTNLRPGRVVFVRACSSHPPSGRNLLVTRPLTPFLLFYSYLPPLVTALCVGLFL